MFHRNGRRPRPPQCVCADTGKCGYCPSIGTTAAREGRTPARRHTIGPTGSVGGNR